jgi:S1-C subfamily serine protease
MGANHLVYQVAGGGAAAGAAHPPGGEGAVDQKAIANMVGMVVNGITLLNPANQLVEGPGLTFEIGVSEASALPREEFKAMCHILYPNVDPKTKKIVSYNYGVNGSGSCFLITPDGYAITNQHVTEGVYYAQNHPVVINRLKRSAWPAKRGWKVNQAHFWVFLNGKAHNARVVYQSRKFDFSILKIAGISGAPFFKLSAKKKPDDLVVKTKVVTLGFPGSSRSRGLRGEKEEESLNKTKRKIKDWFLDSDLKFVLKEGVVAVVKDRLDKGLIIEHDATINGGNSGGPLVSSAGLNNPTQDAVVYGINTWTITTGDNSYLSIMMETVRKDIERHVPNAVWVDK